MLPWCRSNFYVGDTLPGTLGTYQVEGFLGEGAYAEVVRCKNTLTGQTVAVKIMKEDAVSFGDEEVAMLRKLNELDEDSRDNIVRFIEHFAYDGQVFLVFEKLRRSLYDVVDTMNTPMTLYEIRIITKGLLRALNALKSINMAHTDVKIDNIMTAPDPSQSFKVKLIDFGLATEVSRLWLGGGFQVVGYRAPEVMLGLPLTEAIDMWSFGCSLAVLYIGQYLFPTSCEYKYMSEIVRILGQPDHQMLNSGIYTRDFFHKDQDSPSAPWRLNTPEEYGRETGETSETYRGKFSSLDDLVTQVPARNRIEDEDPRPFVNLLKRMLCINPDKRITPSEALEHPFITGEYFDSDSDQLVANEETTATAGGSAADSVVVPPAAETQMDYKQRNIFRIGDILSGESTKYQIESFFRHGKYGKFAQCIDLTTKEKMAVKIWQKQFAKLGQEEAYVLKKLNKVDENLRKNLVRFTDHFACRRNICLAFEMLDVDVLSIMEKRLKPMTLHDIRITAEGLLQALNVLKSINVVHADIRPQKIMIVPSLSQPFNVKLIGFGFATEVSRLWRGTYTQTIGYRAPEVTLGQPLSEAIDMWSLGCVLAFLYLRDDLYSTHCEYQSIRDTVRMRGQPGDHLLNSGIYTRNFFSKYQDTPIGSWQIKTAHGYWLETGIIAGKPLNKFKSLNDLAQKLPAREEFEDEDPQAFVDLLRQMLNVDPGERITPAEALEHAFIKDRHVHRPSVHDLHLKSDSTSLTSEECELEQSSDQPSSSASCSKDMGSNHPNGNIIMVVSAADKDDDPPATENLDEATASSSNERNSVTADPASGGNNDGLQTTENLDETSEGSLNDRFSATAYTSTDGNNDDPPATENLDEATATSSNERNSDTPDPATDRNNDFATPGTSKKTAGRNCSVSLASINQNIVKTDSDSFEEIDSFVEVKTKMKWLKRVQLFFSRIGKIGSCCSRHTVAVNK